MQAQSSGSHGHLCSVSVIKEGYETKLLCSVLLADLFHSPSHGMASTATTLYLELHKRFIHNLDRAKDSYEYVVTDQLRMSGELLNRHHIVVLFQAIV